jgi:hypothetical protein
MQKKLTTPSETIDIMVDEKKKELDRVYNRFEGGGHGPCPLCKSLEKGNIPWIDEDYSI